EADRVNLLTDAWALVEAKRKPLSHYLELIDKVTPQDQLAVYDQIIDTFSYINRLLAGETERAQFQKYARGVLQPAFARVGWEAQPNESFSTPFLRASLIRGLGVLDDPEVIAGCRARFEKFIKDPATIAPELRPVIFGVVGRYADAQTWEKLHELGMKTTSTEEKQNYYTALAGALDAKLIPRTLALALTDELPVSRATTLLGYAARNGEHPDLVWDFAQKHMKALLAKQDALGVNSFAAGLFNFYSDPKDAGTLDAYAKSHLPKGAEKAVAKAVDEIGFRAEFKQQLLR
ncbi:MAG TPA: ERAP1-like C-terminal domain-containing protein, partial [Chthoniobacterales bacterium]